MKDFHFFASSIFDWAVTTERRDLSGLIKVMTEFGHDFTVWLVPCSSDTHYAIEWYQPKVEGAIVVGQFEVAKKRPARRSVAREAITAV